MKQTVIRPMSTKREERLRAQGALRPGSTFRLNRLPEKRTRRHPRPKGPTSETVRLVLARDGWRCVPCGGEIGPVRGLDYSLHHRRFRDGRPDSHTPQNLITVCGSSNVDRDHGRIHKHRTWAKDNGYWVSRNAGTDPLLVPVFVAAIGHRVWLTATGEYSANPPEVSRG